MVRGNQMLNPGTDKHVCFSNLSFAILMTANVNIFAGLCPVTEKVSFPKRKDLHQHFSMS